MNQENRQCQNCKQRFTIEPEDFKFYEKMKAPPPTWCPECRTIRRFSFRNARTLYKRSVIGVEKEILSGISPDSPLKVYEQKHWWSDKWDPMKYARDYDFSRPFFSQIKDLIFEVPWPHGYNVNSVNSEYCNNVDGLKDCYLMFNSGYSEKCSYGTDVLRSINCIDATRAEGCELCYGITDCDKCYRCFSTRDCVECSNIYFSYNLLDCHDCFGCVNLRHKKFCVFNEQYTENEYKKIVRGFNIGSYRNFREFQEKIGTLLKTVPHKYMHGKNNVNVTGDYINHSKNTKNSFVSSGLENCAHCQLILFYNSHDCYDMDVAGGELCYEIEEAGGYNIKFCWLALPKNLKNNQINLSDLECSVNVFNSSHLFACVGLRNKQYCILNKQYTKEEYESLVPRIIKHMNDMPYTDKSGRVYRYGEFCPPELSPFAYNETIAQEYFPLSKEQAIEQGYRWKDPETKEYKVTMKSESLPDHIKDVDDGILKETIGCAHAVISGNQPLNQRLSASCNEQCTTAFKIIKEELQFYRKMNLPLPRLCPNCRHYQRLKQRNPLKLWHRKCQCVGTHSQNGTYQNTAKHSHGNNPCSNEFETSYAPERKEIVYSESCYNAEVV